MQEYIMNEINLAARLAQGLLAVTIVFVIGLGFQLAILYEGGTFTATHNEPAAIAAVQGQELPHNNASRLS
jgi:hypothetical protein